jgi:hypothetical protein
VAQGEFKHITVTPADDDDIVINAGVVKPSETVSYGLDEDLDSTQAESSLAEKSDAPSAESGEKPAEADAASAAVRKTRGESAKKKDDYHEVTLEDLQGEPMSLTQRIVIIAAVVCIIGALAYYFLFLR